MDAEESPISSTYNVPLAGIRPTSLAQHGSAQHIKSFAPCKLQIVTHMSQRTEMIPNTVHLATRETPGSAAILAAPDGRTLGRSRLEAGALRRLTRRNT